MCGIAIQVATEGSICDPLNLAQIYHRGPDSQGEWLSPDRRVWFGHTRLAILDLSPAGHQPMIDERSGVILVFNGEIYNHLEIRKEIGDYPWKGSSDTETLLVAYQKWGERLFSQLNGMFALAFYESTTGDVLLARDACGIKPLYIREVKKGVWSVTSEWRALYPEKQTFVSSLQISAYLRYGHFPEEMLPGVSTQTVPAGSTVRIRRNGELVFNTYRESLEWSEDPLTYQEATGAIRQSIEKAVQRHLLSDVPVASFLSGGIDSTIVSILASRESNRKLQTITVTFRGSHLDESSYAQKIASLIGSQHEEINLVSEQIFPSIFQALEGMDLPSVDGMNTFLVCQKAAQIGTKVALSGLGGDEYFGGYPIFEQIFWLKWIRDHLPCDLLGSVLPVNLGGDRWKEVPKEGDASLMEWRRRKWSNNLLMSMGFPIYSSPVKEREVDLFHLTSMVESENYMRSMLLRDSDQMSMAHSLELRVPLLDREVLNVARRIHGQIYRDEGFPKGLLIKAFHDLLPPEVYQRPKMGFVLPMLEWMKGPLEAVVREGIWEAKNRLSLGDRGLVKMQKETNSGKLHWTRLWSLVVLGHWMKKNHVELRNL